MKCAFLAALTALLACAGCSSLLRSDAKATQVYLLRATPTPQATAPVTTDASIHVGRPIAGPGLDSEHIVLVESDHRMSFYAASRWPTVLPEVVEALAVETLREAGTWNAVQDSSSIFPTDYMLQIVIRRFEADYTGAPGSVPEIHVVFDCTVGRRAGREVLASFAAEGRAVAGANRLADVVTAFEIASNKAVNTIQERSVRAVQAAAQNKPRHE